jgi:hypothetical protein
MIWPEPEVRIEGGASQILGKERPQRFLKPLRSA